MPATTTLTAEQIAAGALELVDREGPDALSMRRLAGELGVGTMTLYGYFRGKDELIDALLDHAAQEIEVPSPEGPWKSQIRDLMREIYAVLRRHPAGVVLRSRTGPMMSAGVLRSTNAGMAILERAGFDKSEATRAWRSLFTYVFGFAAFTPAEVSEEQKRRWQAGLASLPADELPRIVAAAAEFAQAAGGQEVFDDGLDLLLDGLETRLEARR